MRKKANVIFVFLVIVFAVSVFYAFLKFFVLRDYMVYGEAECDPSAQSCFVYTCDPTTEECADDPEEDTSYYQIVSKNAQNIFVCDPQAQECPELFCTSGEKDCEVIFCTEEAALEQGESVKCSNPEDFQEEESLEEEDMEEGLEEGGEEMVEGEEELGTGESEENASEDHQVAP